MKTGHYFKYSVIRLLCCISAIACGDGAFAFPVDTYAQSSRLAQGRWVKISVPKSGVYMISKQQLRDWGFTDPQAVRVYGYGGARIADKLDSYIDDLPLVQSVVTSHGVVFYGVGPEKWVESVSGKFRCEHNIYTNAGYYFVTQDGGEALREIPSQGGTASSSAATTFMDRVHYENDITSPGEAGYVLVGENFKHQNNRKISFNIPGYVDGKSMWMECTLVSKTATATTVSYTANGNPLSAVSSDKINAVSSSAYIHGGYTRSVHTITGVTGNKLDLTVTINNIGNVQNCWLDYISLNYTRTLALPADGALAFWSSTTSLKMTADNPEGVVVWDVTEPNAITALNTATTSDNLSWKNDYTGMRSYVAWKDAATLPAPGFAGVVANQDIHGMENVDMVIFALPEFVGQARRLAALHASSQRPLKVAVLNVEEVYNEFSSGSADVSGLRKCLKMFYDRSVGTAGPKLGYALLMGRSTYDNRHLTSQFSGAAAHGTIPYWMGGSANSQFSDNDAFGTDDFIAMLEDNSGTNLGLDNLCVAVGRLPVTSVSEARNAIDKIEDYMTNSVSGTWKNSFLFLADDGDNGIHAQQTESMIRCLTETPNQQNFITKVYVDAYDIVGGVCEGGRNEMFRMLDEGIVWWNFCGHANNHSWTAENMLTYTDINNMYLKKVPVLLATTCDFLRWDSNIISGGEILFHERNGGTIATISATRPVYISDNGLFSKAMGRSISYRDENGNLPRLGDIYCRAKNNILTDNGEHRANANRLRYVLMGDPAMPLATPSNKVVLESIGGVAVTEEAQVTIKALEQTVVKGAVCTPDGTVIEDFNGTVLINMYDAERSITTKGTRDENIKLTFEQHGDKLFSGSAAVTNGRFEVRVSMPGEISDNFRPALLNMFAYDNNGTEAAGINKEFYVYGLDEDVAPDTEAPVIESMVLNTASFSNGDKVNESPMVIAKITDNVGINLSSAGVGHQMVLTLDGRKTYTDVSLFYTPNPDGTPGGTINYPMSDLADGDHTLVLKVWDTAANSAQKEVAFSVENGLTPSIFNVYTDTNPASTAAKFYVTHDRPDARMTVTITVYNLLGHPLWQTTEVGQSDMFNSAPVTWDLCDSSGRRVPRGIYLYRASISADGEHFETSARKLAVTAGATPQ